MSSVLRPYACHFYPKPCSSVCPSFPSTYGISTHSFLSFPWFCRFLWKMVYKRPVTWSANEQSKFPASDSAILCWCVCVEGGRWAWRTKMEPRSGSLPKSWKTRHLTFWSQKALLPTNTTGYFTEYQKKRSGAMGEWGRWMRSPISGDTERQRR